MDNCTSVVLPISKKARTNKPRRRDGEATQSLLYAVAQSLKAIVPIESLAVWLPSSVHIGNHRVQRQKCAANGHYYLWDPDTKDAKWCLPPELRTDDVTTRNVRLLTIVADEGSTGWSLMQWLALKHRVRVFWHRDPLHKLSNLFTNSLKSTSAILTVVFKHLIVHKWRRAPFGSGKFWRGLQESLEIVTNACGPKHPMFEFVYEGIRKDYDDPGMTHTRAWELLGELLNEPIGPKVQMRRWFTIHDAGWGVDRMWNTMLFALVMQYSMDGTNAFKLAEEVVPVIQKGDSKEAQNFKFRQQVLIIFMDSYNQRILRSVLHVFKRIRLHHSSFTESAKTPSACLELHQNVVRP